MNSDSCSYQDLLGEVIFIIYKPSIVQWTLAVLIQCENKKMFNREKLLVKIIYLFIHTLFDLIIIDKVAITKTLEWRLFF